MTDLGKIAAESVDAVYARVLRPRGFVLITCPDLQEVCRLVANDLLIDTAYLSPAGPVAPIDMIYGHRASLAAGKAFMAHRCGSRRACSRHARP